MTGEQLATLVNIGAAGAVIAVVIVFLRFIKERDADWRNFFTAIRQTDGEAAAKQMALIERLIGRMEHLEEKFDRHDAIEMEFLRSLDDRKRGKECPSP